MEPLQQLHSSSDALSYRSNRTTLGVFALALFVAAVLIIVSEAFPAADPQEHVAAAAGNDPFAGISLIAKSAVVVDLTTGETLFALNPDAQLPLASLVKVPLALSAASVLREDAELFVSQNIMGTGGDVLPGGHWRVRDIIDFTLVSSSNAGAEFLASASDALLREQVENASETPTIERMNELAQKIGLRQTFFLNVTGLDISTTLSGAYGSAEDMALLFSYALRSQPSLFSETAHESVVLTSPRGGMQTEVTNTNLAEGEIPGLILGKTGFTDLAGGNLAVVFDVGIGHPIVAVVLGSTEDGRFEDLKTLIAAARAAIAQ